MTPITRPVRRQTTATVHHRPLVIELHTWGCRVREKGRRHAYDVSYRQIYDLGGKLKADETRRERIARNTGRRVQ